MESVNKLRIKVAYGIDMSGGFVSVVRATKGGWSELDVASSHLADIQAKVADEKAAIVATLSVKESFSQKIEAPFPSVSKARKVFQSLLDIHLPFPVESCVCSFVNVRQTDTGTVAALAIGARTETVAAQIERLKEVGIDPEILDHEGLALWDLAVKDCPREPKTEVVVAYLGRDRLVLSVGNGVIYKYARNTDVKIEKNIPDQRSLDRITRRMSGGLPAKESASSMLWIWTGPQAESLSARTAIEKALGYDSTLNAKVAEAPASFLARALALRALGRAGNSVNCRAEQFLHTAVSAANRQRMLVLATTFLIAGLCLCAGNILWMILINRSNERIQRRLRERTVEISGVEHPQKGMEMLVVRNAIDRRREQARSLMAFFKSSAGQSMTEIVNFASELGLYLDSISIRSGNLEIRGSAPNWESPDRFSDYCREKGYANELKRDEAGADERVHFSLTGGVNED